MAYEEEKESLKKLSHLQKRKLFSIGAYSEGVMCLEKSSKSWNVYYAERNQKWDVHEFNTEDKAYHFLYNKLKSEYL